MTSEPAETTHQVRWCPCCEGWIEVPTDVDHAFEDDETGAAR